MPFETSIYRRSGGDSTRRQRRKRLQHERRADPQGGSTLPQSPDVGTCGASLLALRDSHFPSEGSTADRQSSPVSARRRRGGRGSRWRQARALCLPRYCRPFDGSGVRWTKVGQSECSEAAWSSPRGLTLMTTKGNETMKPTERRDPQPDHGKGPPEGKGQPVDHGRPVHSFKPAAGTSGTISKKVFRSSN